MLNNNRLSTTEKANTDATRRSFIKKAAIASPIIVASSATPAWGVACMSGIMSGNLSNHTQPSCDLTGGLSHGHWKNHWVGQSDKHFKNGDRTKGLKNKFKHHMGQFFVKLGQNYIFSQYKSDDVLLGRTFIANLKLAGDFSYERELVTALINASLQAQLNYPYSISDINEIANQVVLDPSIADNVTNLLEGIHSPA